MRDAAYRLDVAEAVENAARAELSFHDTYLARVSGVVVRELAEWSEPTTVRVRMVPSETKPGIVEIEVERVEQ